MTYYPSDQELYADQGKTILFPMTSDEVEIQRLREKGFFDFFAEPDYNLPTTRFDAPMVSPMTLSLEQIMGLEQWDDDDEVIYASSKVIDPPREVKLEEEVTDVSFKAKWDIDDESEDAGMSDSSIEIITDAQGTAVLKAQAHDILDRSMRLYDPTPVSHIEPKSASANTSERKRSLTRYSKQPARTTRSSKRQRGEEPTNHGLDTDASQKKKKRIKYTVPKSSFASRPDRKT